MPRPSRRTPVTARPRLEALEDRLAFNAAPILSPPPSLTLVEGLPISFALQAADPDGDPLTYGQMGLPPFAALDAQTGQVTGIVPAGLPAGPIALFFHVTDGQLSDGRGVTWNVPASGPGEEGGAGGGGGAVANPDAYAVTAGQVLTVPAPGVLANDVPGGGSLAAVLTAGPAHGAVTLNANGSFVYAPAPGFTGADTFTYAAAPGASAQVTVHVQPPGGGGGVPNPTANPDAYTTPAGQPLLVSAAQGLLANDTGSGAPLAAVLEQGPAHGTVALNANGSFAYTPAPNFAGIDSFTYRAVAGQSQSAPALVVLTVHGARPLATPDLAWCQVGLDTG